MTAADAFQAWAIKAAIVATISTFGLFAICYLGLFLYRHRRSK